MWLYNVLSATSNVFTIVASAIVIYIFYTKRETIKSVFKILLNYSFQITLSELRAKLDKLNDLNVNEPSHVDQIVNILNEIVGQIRGNIKLKCQCSDLLLQITEIAENRKKLSEPKKRSLVSELREHLRHINVETYDETISR